MVACLALAAACAAPDAEVQLAPLYARHTAPGFARTEVLGGAVRHEVHGDDSIWALSPLWWYRRGADAALEADFLFALGRLRHDPDRPMTRVRLFPLGWWRGETRVDGVRDTDWQLLFGLAGGGAAEDGGEDSFWVFPFGGVARDFLTYDEIRFALFPLWMRTEKDGVVTDHVLWPLLGRTRGRARGWRFYPFYGVQERPGVYRRRSFLWPFVHVVEEDLDTGQPLRGWLVLLVGGHREQGDSEANSLLFPIVGWSRKPSTGYRAWQVYPFLKFVRGGGEGTETTRVWPLWIHYVAPDTEFESVLWPLFWWRRDRLEDGGQRRAAWALPFVQLSRSRWPDGGRAHADRLWPLASDVSERDGSRVRRLLDPGLAPVLHPEVVSRNFGWIWEFWSDRERPAAPTPWRERRGWLGLYHEVEAGGHRRWSVPGLVGRWHEPDGTTHTSLLFGLLRWRTGEDGGLESPAFPGPGWPSLTHGAAPSATAPDGGEVRP